MAKATDVIPDETRLTETHEYIRVEDDRARVGISHYAAESLGDIVFVELPENGEVFEKGDSFGSIESVKAASDLYLPVSGEVVAINTGLQEEPDLVNDDCYGDGWIIEIKLNNPDEIKELMDADAYMKFLEENDG